MTRRDALKTLPLVIATSIVNPSIKQVCRPCPPSPEWKEEKVLSAKEMNACFDFALKHMRCLPNGCLYD